MNVVDLDFMSDLVRGRIGIVLGREKDYLLDTRLAPVARQFGFLSVAQLVHEIRKGNKTAEAAAIEAMTTNETLFFRDRLPFEQLERTILPSLTSKKPIGSEIRIWSAACSCGQEPYSISMLLDSKPAWQSRNRYSILATDVSHAMIDKARNGYYTQFEIQRGLSPRNRDLYFTQDGPVWKISSKILQMVQLRQLNILDDLTSLGTFDIIMCRNLLIYFDEETKKSVLRKLYQRLSPDGFLVLGAAETVIGLSSEFDAHPAERALYVPRRQSRAGAFGHLSQGSLTAA
jgi:chemotaxis protein methyltransferase CheR